MLQALVLLSHRWLRAVSARRFITEGRRRHDIAYWRYATRSR